MSFYYGVAYYPEVWDIAEIEKDIIKMKEMGLNTVRIGEFAWSTMEKKEGVFDFSLFQYTIEKMQNAGINVIMCTPSCTPPKWLTDKYPETLIENDFGVKYQFGARCHACKSNGKFREKVSIIVNELCKALSDYKAIIGWQIDNEIYPYNNGCFCPDCKKSFIEYMRVKYSTIDNLNNIWGNARWSLTYQSFEDIIPPRSDTWNHPSLQADWLDFQSSVLIDFVSFQADIIRKYSSAPIGTDMMTACAVSHSDMNKNLDVVQLNHYEREKDFFHQAFWFDYMRTIKDKPFWCTETQTCWNGAFQADFGAKNIKNCYANTLMPFFKGGEMNLYWLWRTHPAGQELMHGAILDCAGRDYYTNDQIVKAISDLEISKKFIKSNCIKSDIAIHFSTKSFTQFSYVPVVEGFNYLDELYNIYNGFLGTNVDIICEDSNISDYKVLISPFLSYIDKNLRDKIEKFVSNGGTWIVGPLSDIFDNYLRKYTNEPFGFLEKIAGVKLKYNIPVNHIDYKAKFINGKSLKIDKYYDAFLLNGARSIAKYSTGDLSGYSVITENEYGQGKVIMIGSFVSAKTYLQLSNIQPYFKCSDNIIVNYRNSNLKCYSVIEAFGKTGFIKLNGKYKNIIDQKIYKGKVKVSPFEAFLFIDCK